MTRNINEKKVKSFANSKQVMHFIDRAFPDVPDTRKSLIADRSEKCFYLWRRKEQMYLETAEDVLDAFDLGYLLHTGDIDTWEVEVVESVYATLRKSQAHNVKLREEVKELKATIASLSPKCKDCVKALDGNTNV